MSELDDLIELRHKHRKIQYDLTQEIKKKRREESAANQLKKLQEETTSTKHQRHYNELRKENRRLRGLIALLGKADDRTYAKVGVLLGVSGSRARDIVGNECRLLRWNEQRISSE